MSDPSHLSQIVTLWSVVRRAHDGQSDAVQAAQQEMLDRYGGAVRRYLLGSLRNEDAADEVFQEFALRFVRGDFEKVDPMQGRFRAYLKTVVYRLVVDYQRRKQRQGRQQPLVEEGPACQAEPLDNSDQQFLDGWRAELLARCWTALEQSGDREGTPYFTVLRFRAEHPELRSAELAKPLGELLGKPLAAGNVRVLIHRARRRFAELLLEEVAHSLDTHDRETLSQELIELNLYEYCREMLAEQHNSN